MKPIIRATTNPDMTEREKKNYALARRAAAEGMVLLENRGALPLKADTVALYGLGARHPSFGGTGSGENAPRYQVTPEQGLKNAGIKITTGSWLDDLDETWNMLHDIWKESIAEELRHIPVPERFEYSCKYPFRPPVGRPVLLGDIRDSKTDTAIYILTRVGGEGVDRKTETGDWFLTATEISHLRALTEHYDNVILIINSGGVIDLSPVDDMELGAILYASEGGMEMGNALADVLTGVVTPSGKLTDTWGARYEDYPGAEHFADRDGDPLNEYYHEGIYVGYRWFDVQDIKPRYPFGYGLSYTTFEQESQGIQVNNSYVDVRVKVKNTGLYQGAQIAQLYMAAPNGSLPKEKKSLVAFGRTSVLKPGGSQYIHLTFDMRDFASYDAENGRFVLEGGNYVLLLGDSAGSVKPIGTLFLDGDAPTELCDRVCPPKEYIAWENIPSFVPCGPVEPIIPIKSSSIYCERHSYKKLPFTPHPKADFIMEKLTPQDMLKITIGTSYVGSIHNMVFGPAGYTTSEYVDIGLENMPMADGPQGLNLTPEAVQPLTNRISSPVLPEAMQFGANNVWKSMSLPRKKERRTVYYQYCTAWPCETQMAQTWDVDLLELVGDAVGTEMKELGIVFWLAPGMNLHRNPLGGRNFEYYSEDPYLTGAMASAVPKGVQSHPGCFVTLKHFACNNQETERKNLNIHLDERTLRETYLRAFRMAVKAGARGVMSSYNMINGVYSPNNKDLLTKVLRMEWGFDGLVMTDWYASGHGDCKDELCIPAGNDLIMPGSPRVYKEVAKKIREGCMTSDDLMHAAYNVVCASVDSCVSSELFKK